MPRPDARVLIWVTHLLGTGHLFRALEIARALRQRGAAVKLVSGGFPVAGVDTDGVDVVQLPPVRSSDDAFSGVLQATDDVPDTDYMRRRQEMLLDVAREFRPTVVVTELFPFGRRKFRSEIIPLLDWCKGLAHRPKVVCSIRDILQPPSSKDKAAAAVDTFTARYDVCLAHGDRGIANLEDSFSLPDTIAGRVVYTGYIARAAETGSGRDADGEILVSAGGGAVGTRLYEAAIEASREGALRWRILVGQNVAEEAFSSWTSSRHDRLLVERARADFPAMLDFARLSVSQAGYNTVAESLASGVPCVLVPFRGSGGETEQEERAGRLQEAGRAVVLGEAELDGAGLRKAVDSALADMPVRFEPVPANGADRSADMILSLPEEPTS